MVSKGNLSNARINPVMSQSKGLLRWQMILNKQNHLTKKKGKKTKQKKEKKQNKTYFIKEKQKKNKKHINWST